MSYDGGLIGDWNRLDSGKRRDLRRGVFLRVKSRLLKNLRRAGHYDARKTPKCLECRKRQEWLGRLPGDAPPGSLADENMKTGLCSWLCWARFYNLLENGNLVCRCGSSDIRTPGANCIRCQRTGPHRISESAQFVYAGKENFLNELSST